MTAPTAYRTASMARKTTGDDQFEFEFALDLLLDGLDRLR
jgi:hypothetical protein